jgi:hypothetical protein
MQIPKRDQEKVAPRRNSPFPMHSTTKKTKPPCHKCILGCLLNNLLENDDHMSQKFPVLVLSGQKVDLTVSVHAVPKSNVSPGKAFFRNITTTVTGLLDTLENQILMDVNG